MSRQYLSEKKKVQQSTTVTERKGATVSTRKGKRQRSLLEWDLKSTSPSPGRLLFPPASSSGTSEQTNKKACIVDFMIVVLFSCVPIFRTFSGLSPLPAGFSFGVSVFACTMHKTCLPVALYCQRFVQHRVSSAFPFGLTVDHMDEIRQSREISIPLYQICTMLIQSLPLEDGLNYSFQLLPRS